MVGGYLFPLAHLLPADLHPVRRADLFTSQWLRDHRHGGTLSLPQYALLPLGSQHVAHRLIHVGLLPSHHLSKRSHQH